MALDWAKKYQILQPWSAWAYTTEAALSTNADARLALKFAMYLDPGSQRLATIPAELRAKAERDNAGKNPFELRATKPNVAATSL